MNKVAWVAMLLPLSFAAYAETGGFEAGKTPPPQQKEDAGYKGSEDTAETPVKLIKDFRQGGYATLEGFIVKKVKGDMYQFRDSTGTVNIEAPAVTFKGKTYSAEDKVRVSGKVFGKGDKTQLKVSRIDEP
ncbi:YgiW/YdeI family stress tolerance OB fold protein [Candidatus Pantoea formicae]|uniref:YgiW/YdeI family stress tolerance OB fold protein n=1 Tax=Candidatus Pantoea formicae TaxID=2608355 RepID=UPI003ED9643D